MKKLILISAFVLLTFAVFAQVDTTWTKTVQIDTTEIIFNLRVIQNERVIFQPSQPIPLTDRRWDWYFRLCRNVWTVEQAEQKIQQMER